MREQVEAGAKNSNRPTIGGLTFLDARRGEPELVTSNDFPASRPFTIPSVVAGAHDDP